VVACVLAFAVLFALFMLDNLLVFIPPSIGAVIEYISFGYHLDNLSRGVIDSRDLLYFLSLTILGLALASDRLADRKA
jgi:ABC-2 type transport system permease protein